MSREAYPRLCFLHTIHDSRDNSCQRSAGPHFQDFSKISRVCQKDDSCHRGQVADVEDAHLSVPILFIQPFSSLRDEIFPLRSCPFSIFLVACFPRSIRSHLRRQVVSQALVGMLVHFLPEGPSLRRVLVVPLSHEAPFHELLISDPVRSKMPQGLQRLYPSSLPGSIISIAERRVSHSPPLFRREVPS